MVAEGLNYCKSARSKIDGYSYTFEYIKKEDLPDNYKKSANIRPKKYTDIEKKQKQKEHIRKWQNKKYKCPNRDKIIKNASKYSHEKRCN